MKNYTTPRYTCLLITDTSEVKLNIIHWQRATLIEMLAEAKINIEWEVEENNYTY